MKLFVAATAAFFTRDVFCEVHDFVAVTYFVVVPADELYERRRKHNAGVRVENRRSRVAEEVARNHCVFGVAEN